MHEDILTAVDGINKAEALLVIPVLHGARDLVRYAPAPRRAAAAAAAWWIRAAAG